MSTKEVTYNDLNTGQKKAVDEFFEFLFSDDKVFHLRGPAGVGKTFVLNFIMNNIYSKYIDACKVLQIPCNYTDIALTATTNKAAEVLSVTTGRDATTIHNFLRLKVTEDFTTGETFLKKRNDYVVHSGYILFIDEASMIDAGLYKILNETMHKSKIVYIGDHSQLAPVFEEQSRIYNDMTRHADLTEPVRNAGQPALMALCDQLRETVRTGVFNHIQPVPGVIEYLSGEQMQYMLDNLFIDPDIDSRILCYSNRQVIDYNNYIRMVRGYPDQFSVGEHLVSANATEIGKDRLSVEEEIIVSKCDPAPVTKSVQGTEFDVYIAEIESTKSGNKFTVNIPYNPVHFNSLIKHYAKVKNWSAYFHLKNQFPDLRPKDAATVYKAQGSTYDSVFMDLENISTCTHAKQVARMLYVGVSRPRTKLYLYGNLKPEYGGF